MRHRAASTIARLDHFGRAHLVWRLYAQKLPRYLLRKHIGKNRVVLEPNKYLYKPHIDKYSSEYNVPFGKVVVNKNNPSLWGIKLNLNNPILVKDSGGKEKSIDGHGVIPIINKLKVKFTDSAIAEIISDN